VPPAPLLLDPRDEAPERRAALRAWLALQAVWHLDPGRAAAALRRCGDPRSALRAEGVAPAWSGRQLDDAVHRLQRCGARGVPLVSPSYPRSLVPLADAAPLLWVVGDPGALCETAVAIVGSRAATDYGLEVAHRLAFDLAQRGVVVLSGLARGIDAAAHRGALEAGGRTVAFQACGPDRVYPGEHRALAEEIARRGAVASEHPPGTPPLPAYFPLRNRLIAAAARVVVVVEARERSGSLITARCAAERGQHGVMAVPGPIDTPTCAGSNRLLRDGARPALGSADVFEELGWPRCEPGEEETPEAPLAPEAEEIVRALRRAPRTRDELGRRLGRSPAELALHLVQLELAGRVVEDRDGRLRVRARRRARRRPGAGSASR
jgi:DNA processing protein